MPSSSKLSEPHSFCTVPSSTADTTVEAICSPSFPAYTEFPFATEVASSPCPQASWNITPPNLLSSTTGNFPLGADFASSIVTATLDASLAISSTDISS